MSKAPKLEQNPELLEQIRLEALAGRLVLFVGAGISRLVGLPSWDKLASIALDDLLKVNQLNYFELEQLSNLDPKIKLSIAKLIAKQNGYKLDLVRHLNTKDFEKGIYNILNNIGCACVTTNYDELLSPCFSPTKNGSTTKTSTTRISRREAFITTDLQPGTVVHLHGSISEQSSMIITTREYLEHYDNENVQYFLKKLFKTKTVLFIGYGLEEAEILEHILRRGDSRATGEQKLFSLQGFFRSEESLYMKLHQYYLETFGLYLIGFVRDYKDYGQLEDIIKIWSEKIEVRPKALAEDLDFMEEVLGGT